MAIADTLEKDTATRTGGALSVARRYSLSILGPISVSGAHFLASFVVLHELQQADFGLFSFLLAVVPFLGVSAAGALLNAPLGNLMAGRATFDAAEYSTLFKAALLVTALVGLLASALLVLSHASLPVAVMAGPYAALMGLRWFGRCFAFAEGRKAPAVMSDLVYSTCLVLGIVMLVATKELSLVSGTAVLLVSALLGMCALGGTYLRRQFWALGGGRLAAYRPIFMDMTRWALFGVVLSELTSNAHAYLVTFVAGPGAFAVLAIGALMMRPVSLVLSALPDFERPRMSRAIATGDQRLAFRSVNEFRTAGGAIWLATIALAGVLLAWFPHLILKNGYDRGEVIAVIAVWAVIMAARLFRTPESILLQSAGAFKSLASASLKSSIASVVATLILLFTFGPLAALCGILIGELVMTSETIILFRAWKRDWVASCG